MDEMLLSDTHSTKPDMTVVLPTLTADDFPKLEHKKRSSGSGERGKIYNSLPDGSAVQPILALEMS